MLHIMFVIGSFWKPVLREGGAGDTLGQQEEAGDRPQQCRGNNWDKVVVNMWQSRCNNLGKVVVNSR